MNAPRRRLGLLAVVVLVAAASLAGWRLQVSAPTSGPPFALSVDRRRFSATVLERLEAGDYRYLRVRDDAGATLWLVTLADVSRPAQSSPRVAARTFGRVDRFHSARLGRDFPSLFFTAVEPAP